MGPYADDPEHPAPPFPGASAGSSERALGGPLLSTLSRLPREALPVLERFVALMGDFPESVAPLERMVDAAFDDRPIAACRAALDVVAAFFDDDDDA